MSSARGNSRLRVIDRYLGVPLVYITGIVRRKRAIPKNPAHLGLLNTAAIGDTVLMSAVVADLRSFCRSATITLFVGPSNYQVALMIEGVDRVVELRVFNPMASLREVRRHQVDILLDFGPWPRLNSLITRFSGAGFSVGFRTNGEYRHYGYDIAVEHGNDVHELENHRRLVRALGVVDSHPPSIRTATGCCPRRKNKERFAVLHMWPGGAGAKFKEWPADHWLALSDELARAGYRLLLTGSMDQHRRNELFLSSLSPLIRTSVHNVAGASLAETLSILSRASLVVSVNTGVMHMAAAAGVPLVALHGPTSARRWGPVSDFAISIESPLSGCGYLDLGFEYPRRSLPCMEAISTESVIRACHLALQRFEPSSRPGAVARQSTVAHQPVCKCGVSKCARRRGEEPAKEPVTQA